jgi:hypothetical protein
MGWMKLCCSWDKLRMKACRLGVLSTLLFCALFLSACAIVPVKTTTAIKDPAGQKTRLPAETLIPGETTRDQVEARYKAFAVNSGMPSLFWGRFQKSSWAVVASGFFGVLADAQRVWGGYNLLASFDANGTLKSFETIPDKELLARFAAMRHEPSFPALNFLQPIRLEVKPELPWLPTAEIQLCAHEVEVTMDRQGSKITKRVVSKIPVTQVIEIKVRGIDYTTDPVDIPLELLFSEKTVFGKKISFSAKPEVALMLVRWMEQAKGR